MSANNIIYSGLRAEMARRKVLISDLANCLGKGREVTGRRLSVPGRIKLGEAFRIMDTFFPDKDIRDLFAEDLPVKEC